jgi:hypothetical protein
MFSRAGRAALLDRKPFTEAFFDNDAAADAALLVSSVAGATYLGAILISDTAGFSVEGIARTVITGLISWLILALATWFSASRLFDGGGRPQTMLGLHGLAVLPLLLELAGGWLAGLGTVWYLVILGLATREAAGLTTREGAVSVLIGFAVVAIFRAIIGVPFAVFGALAG